MNLQEEFSLGTTSSLHFHEFSWSKERLQGFLKIVGGRRAVNLLVCLA